MKTIFKLKTVLILVCIIAFGGIANAQNQAKPVASPRDSVQGVVDSATISINYGSPSVRGRVIWGKLVPLDTVWRTGANAATRFTTNHDIKVQGKRLPAGTYGFFAIPGKHKWIIIFNSVANQWGAFKYDAGKDVLRVKAKAKKTDMHERLVYTIDDKGFALTWEKLTVPVKIKLAK